MADIPQEFTRQADQLVEQLRLIGEFRRGTVNVVYRKCGKKRCVCNQEGHPGHGPQFTLTFSEHGKTRTRNLSTSAAVELVRQQVRNRQRFVEWSKSWRELNEHISDLKLDEVLAGREVEEDTPEKKRPRRSSRNSGGRLSS